MRIGLKVLCALTLVGWAPGYATMVNADSLKVKIGQGQVLGKTINGGKVRAFLGLPYAAPLRWASCAGARPQPPVEWKGVREATHYGAHCAQNHVWDDMIFQDSGAARIASF